MLQHDNALMLGQRHKCLASIGDTFVQSILFEMNYPLTWFYSTWSVFVIFTKQQQKNIKTRQWVSQRLQTSAEIIYHNPDPDHNTDQDHPETYLMVKFSCKSARSRLDLDRKSGFWLRILYSGSISKSYPFFPSPRRTFGKAIMQIIWWRTDI